MNPLSSQDRVRASQLFTEYGEQVLGNLQSRFRKAHRNDLSDAFNRAVMQVALKGIKEDRTKGTMYSLLSRVAKARYIDQIRGHTRRTAREQKKSARDVTELEAVSNDPGKAMMERELVAQYFHELAHNDSEKQYLTLWMEGRSDTEIIDSFQTSNSDREQVATLVKHLSERMRQRFSRLRRRLAKEDQP